MAPLTVSVAMCTYNGARFVAEQLASILAQTVPPTEIVIADDGSTDRTLAIVGAAVAGAEELGIRVRVLGMSDRGAGGSGDARRDAAGDARGGSAGHAGGRADGDAAGRHPVSPLGVTANFARAIEACASDVVVLSDQDDLWPVDRLARVTAAFERQPDLLLQHGDARLIDAAGEPLGMTLFQSLGVTIADRARVNAGDAFSVYLRRNLATGATVAFRRHLYATSAPFPPEWVHDEWLAIIAAAIGRVEVSEVPVIDYRQHGGNEIGVPAPTLRYRFDRMLATSPDRNAILAARSRVLVERLAVLAAGGADGAAGADGSGGSGGDARAGGSEPDATAAVAGAHAPATGFAPLVPSELLADATAKARFERARAELPEGRFARLPFIWRASRANSYGRFASQGRLDILRDILQSRT